MTVEPSTVDTPRTARRFGSLVWHEQLAIRACQRFCADRTDGNATAALVALEALRKARAA